MPSRHQHTPKSRRGPSSGRSAATFSREGRRGAFLGALAAVLISALATTPAHAADKPKWALVVHGGAGIIERAEMPPALEAQYRAAMTAAVNRGAAVLDKGGSSLDAIEAVIRGMEDDPLFNAGRGAVFTAEGKVEHDSSIMDGKTLNAGAVAGLTTVRHPITLARRVMEHSPHVMLIGQGAEAFAKAQGLEQVSNSWFYTERRWQGLETEMKKLGLPMPPKPAALAGKSTYVDFPDDHRFGTVGVVALDSAGNVAAGTSTGGTTAKRWGRVGDTPVIGAGNYASNDSCAVSGTGKGEYFIRLTVAREICALVQYRGMTLQAAADEVIQKRMPALMGKDGGVIAIAPDGQMAWSYNTSGMYRAKAAAGQPTVVSIFADEP